MNAELFTVTFSALFPGLLLRYSPGCQSRLSYRGSLKVASTGAPVLLRLFGSSNGLDRNPPKRSTRESAGKFGR